MSDTLGFIDDRVLLTLGVRRQTIEVDAWNTTTRRAQCGLCRVDHRAGLWPGGQALGACGVLRQPYRRLGPRSDGAADQRHQSRRSLAPNRSKQTEAGVKFDWDSYGATLGVYRIEQPNSATNTNANGTNTFSVDGQQINKGVELNVFGEPLDGLRVLAGATWMNTELKRTANGLTRRQSRRRCAAFSVQCGRRLGHCRHPGRCG